MMFEKTTEICIACKDQSLSVSQFSVYEQYPLGHCKNCGLGYLDFKGKDDGFVFEDYWDETNQAIYTEPKTIAELRDKYNYYIVKADDPPNNTLLDVGSGSGIFVDAANSNGFDAMGIEPSSKGVQISRTNYGIEVTYGFLSADDELPRDFGVLTLWDVIEHVSDPEEMVSICSAHLADNGYFLLETPDEGALVRNLVTTISKWVPGVELRENMYYPSHRFYFTKHAMEILLRRCGFYEIRFYKERSMYEKALLKAQLYRDVSGVRLRVLRGIYWLLKRLPFLQNKMVVIARKKPVE